MWSTSSITNNLTKLARNKRSSLFCCNINDKGKSLISVLGFTSLVRKQFGRKAFGRNSTKKSSTVATIAIAVTKFVYWPNACRPNDMAEAVSACKLVGQTSVSQMSVSQMSVGQMSVGQMSVSQMSVTQISAGQMSVSQIYDSQMSVGQMSVGQIVFDQNTWHLRRHLDKRFILLISQPMPSNLGTERGRFCDSKLKVYDSWQDVNPGN
jgi:hypothetical protein